MVKQPSHTKIKLIAFAFLISQSHFRRLIHFRRSVWDFAAVLSFWVISCGNSLFAGRISIHPQLKTFSCVTLNAVQFPTAMQMFPCMCFLFTTTKPQCSISKVVRLFMNETQSMMSNYVSEHAHGRFCKHRDNNRNILCKTINSDLICVVLNIHGILGRRFIHKQVFAVDTQKLIRLSWFSQNSWMMFTEIGCIAPIAFVILYYTYVYSRPR